MNEGDIVFHLGDFGNYEIAKELNGFIKLIPGNYEKNDDYFEDFKHYFDSVLKDNPSYWIEHDINDFTHRYKVTMGHEPSLVKDVQITLNRINVFGHIHKLCMIKPYGINVGTDCHNFRPIDLDTVLFYHNAIFTR